ncbi:A/G-specific adenine glycosylase [Neisseria animalis]|uniref:Adenine DNA glycosylase n=1 Tax=Neisseria animalis TaxID=492 RepID=A0A5P3MQU9_NEIAN|nr:A/G-specific adenine glycosylase [Neisseria animalis]QEY23089.1 A/G-specific adenine glycosylase [Neisseria animalis]ROW32422.1 A/G-specific adenine glycosylase [Neisseria animalis]VEE08107.1 adenine glycosylase [Neisseria animalis]
MADTSVFARRLIDWQRLNGRHGLPWQVKDPYAVWLSEIMLQQTQVATVLDYYPRFLERFPNVRALADAPQDEVLALWAGLGYYSRARNLHKAAQQVVNEFGGKFPQTRQELEKLCGVGRSTAAAIAAFAFDRRETILDGNVKRVLCRLYVQDGNPQDRKFEQQLWQLAESLMPSANSDMPAYTQGLMDLGATVCRRSNPLCGKCPMADMCGAKQQNRIGELPRKKTAVEVQNLPLYWLVVRNGNGAVWLEKRPAKGIWGGLYCVPCFGSLQEMYDYAGQSGIGWDEMEECEAFTHRLTHRLLWVTPFETRSDKMAEGADGIWAEQGEWQAYGLPKPLAKYLQAVCKSA